MLIVAIFPQLRLTLLRSSQHVGSDDAIATIERVLYLGSDRRHSLRDVDGRIVGAQLNAAIAAWTTLPLPAR